MGRIAGVDAAETRERILQVAEDLFADKGFDATGIDEIARSAEITKSVIYYHFKNKDHIRRTIIDQFTNDIMILKQQGAQDLVDGKPQESATVELIMEFFKAREKTVRILMMQSMTGSDNNPLMDLWERNVEIARRYREILLGEPPETHADDAFLDVYFLVFIPVLSYFAYADSWCRRSGLDRNKADKVFADSLTKMFKGFVMKNYGLDKLKLL